MKKEEILEKARSEKKDEMENAVRDRSAVWMALAMVVAAGFFVTMRGEDEPVMDLAALYKAEADMVSDNGNSFGGSDSFRNGKVFYGSLRRAI